MRSSYIPLQSLLVTSLALSLLVIVAVRFAVPIQDGDIFWHMAYAEQMLDHGTLRLDHTLFSWMPSSNSQIYCAWISEFVLWFLWAKFGYLGPVILRYAVVMGVLALLAAHARRCGLLARPETWLVLLITLLASVVATFPKPEILSLFLWNAVLFCWFGLLDSHEKRRAVLPWIYAVPVLMLIWTNTHGGFILAAPFIAITAAASFTLLPWRVAVHMAVATGLCAVATVLNPYGVEYPLQLLTDTLRFASRPDISDNNAYQTSFSSGGQYYHLPELLGWMVLLLGLCCRTRPPGWRVIVLLFTTYALLYVIYVRASFLLPAFFGYAILYLCRHAPWPRVAPVLACAAFLFLGGRSIVQAVLHPEPGAWTGFGIGTMQPVEEAEFIAEGGYGTRIYNTYNAGGYLIWRLFPRDKVMVDARSFPYLEWYPELRQFTRTTDPATFRAFLARHPADVALVDFQEGQVWRSFLQMADWRPAFYGPNAAVFVRVAEAHGPVQAAASLARLRNGSGGALIFDFAVAAGDYATAWQLLDQMQGSLVNEVEAADLARMTHYRWAHEALRARDYGRAWAEFGTAFSRHPIDGQDKTIFLLLRALQQVNPNDPRAMTFRDALAQLAGPA